MPAAPNAQSRDAFAASQVSMTNAWYENIVRSGRDVKAYTQGRLMAYLTRWREAGRYFDAGDRVLDVGGGHLFPELFGLIRERGWDYWYCDIGESEVAHARALAAASGFDPAQYTRKFNHELDYPAESFDALFSSHCIEHSMDLAATLAQAHRLLRDGGAFVMSVPFGFDAQDNHPYFFSEIEWMILLEDVGFTIRAYQVGDEYPEVGQDLMIAARKTGPRKPARIDVERHTKANFAFHDFRAPTVALSGVALTKADHVVLDGPGWRIAVSAPEGASEILPVFVRHDWSGMVLLRSGDDRAAEDLFRPYPVILPGRLALSRPASAGQIVEIVPAGRHPASRGSQGVFMGYLVR